MDNYQPFQSPQFERQQFYVRLLVGSLLMVVLTSVLIGRYYYLQIINYEEFMTRSESNSVLVQPIAPIRGDIYDRNGMSSSALAVICYYVKYKSLSVIAAYHTLGMKRKISFSINSKNNIMTPELEALNQFESSFRTSRLG